MKIKEQYEELQILKKEIDTRLIDLNFDRTKELIRWLHQSKTFQKLKKKDNELMTLDLFIYIWFQEMQEQNSFEYQGSIFYGVESLKDVNAKRVAATMAFYRLENEMPYEYCVEAVMKLVEYRFSGYALYVIMVKDTLEVEKNAIKLARILKECNELVKAIGLLQATRKEHPDNQEILWELADCWIIAQQWKEAYECLCGIEDANDEINEMIKELEKLLSYENI